MTVMRLEFEADEPFLSLKKKVSINVVIHI